MTTPTINQEALTQLTKARIQLIMEQPFFGTLALRLRLKEDLKHKTLAIDGKTVFYNPDFVKSLSTDLTKSALCHEVGHVILQTIGRRNSRDPGKWNRATDYKINQFIEEAGMAVGEGWLRHKPFDGMSADEIYSLLPDDDGGKGPLDEMIEGGGDVDDSEPFTPEDEAEWKIAAVQAANTAKMAGKASAWMERFIDDMLAPKIDWREYLKRFFVSVTQNDFSYRKLNRRMLAHKLYLPTLYSEGMGTMVVAIDTSGSINVPTLTAFASEIEAIRTQTDPERTVVIYCDAEVNHVDEFARGEPLKVKPHGGGGTDFHPPFAWLEENDITPDAFAYLTDGYGPFPDEQNFPVLWVMTTDVKAPFGETIPITL